MEKIVKERKFEMLSIDDLKFVFLLWILGFGISGVTLALEIFRVLHLRKVVKIIFCR